MFENIVNEIKDKNLISAVNFGSEGEPNNLLLVFKKLDFETIEKIKPIVKKSKIAPLIFTKEELLNGADVFPLEFLDIKYPHHTIYGEEIIDEIEFDKKAVRKQLEFELRSKLIHLRESYIWVKDIKKILKAAIPSLMPLFYGLLFLKNTKPPTDLNKLFKLVEEKYKIKLDVLKNIKKGKMENNVKDLIEQLERLIKIVDKIKTIKG